MLPFRQIYLFSFQAGVLDIFMAEKVCHPKYSTLKK